MLGPGSATSACEPGSPGRVRAANLHRHQPLGFGCSGLQAHEVGSPRPSGHGPGVQSGRPGPETPGKAFLGKHSCALNPLRSATFCSLERYATRLGLVPPSGEATQTGDRFCEASSAPGHLSATGGTQSRKAPNKACNLCCPDTYGPRARRILSNSASQRGPRTLGNLALNPSQVGKIPSPKGPPQSPKPQALHP